MTGQPTPIDPVAAWLAEIERAYWEGLEDLIRRAQGRPRASDLSPRPASRADLT